MPIQQATKNGRTRPIARAEYVNPPTAKRIGFAASDDTDEQIWNLGDGSGDTTGIFEGIGAFLAENGPIEHQHVTVRLPCMRHADTLGMLRALLDRIPTGSRDGIDAVLLELVDGPEDVTAVQNALPDIERAFGWTVGHIKLKVLDETARGHLHLREICEAGTGEGGRLEAVYMGFEDLRADLDGPVMLEIRAWGPRICTVVDTAAAFGLYAVGPVHPRIPAVIRGDDAGATALREQIVDEIRAMARYLRACCATGMQAIHRSQLAPITEGFCESEDVVRHCQGAGRAYLERLWKGEVESADQLGAMAHEGYMIDGATLELRRRAVARNVALGVTDESVLEAFEGHER